MDQSLVFTVISLSEFFARHFPNSDWYPYWYLGNPFHYLIGPIVPSLLLVATYIFHASFYQSYIGLIICSLIISSLGIYLFLREWDVTKMQSLITSLLAQFLPWNILLLMSQNGLKHVSFSFLPFLLIIFLRYIRGQKIKYALFFVLLLSTLLLTNASSFLAVLLGLVALLVAEIRGNKKYTSQIVETIIGKTVLLIISSFAIATVWYTPSYWWIMLANPSIGGVPLLRLIWNIFNSLLSFTPIILALLVVTWRHGKIKGFNLFCLLFFTSYIVLTGFRFVADPDFVMDWLGFSLELQLGFALVVGFIVRKFLLKRQMFIVLVMILICGLSLFWLKTTKDIFFYTKSEYMTEIKGIVDLPNQSDARVFLSGSSVFWINYFEAVSQVRGGNDMAAINPYWADAAYQIREGEDKLFSDEWLRILGASYILVHQKDSQEPFHDFKHPEKFADSQKVSEIHGNDLYRLSNVGIARLADKSLLTVSSPTNGADEKALAAYVLALRKPVSFKMESPTKLVTTATVMKNEVVSLAVTYDPEWKITKGKGSIVQDAVGNIIIIPGQTGMQTFEISYQKDMLGPVVSFFIALLSFAAFWKFTFFAPRIRKRLPKLSIGLHDDDKEY